MGVRVKDNAKWWKNGRHTCAGRGWKLDSIHIEYSELLAAWVCREKVRTGHIRYIGWMDVQARVLFSSPKKNRDRRKRQSHDKRCAWFTRHVRRTCFSILHFWYSVVNETQYFVVNSDSVPQALGKAICACSVFSPYEGYPTSLDATRVNQDDFRCPFCDLILYNPNWGWGWQYNHGIFTWSTNIAVGTWYCFFLFLLRRKRVRFRNRVYLDLMDYNLYTVLCCTTYEYLFVYTYLLLCSVLLYCWCCHRLPDDDVFCSRGSPRMIPVFYFSSFKHDVFSRYPLAVHVAFLASTIFVYNSYHTS